jgi:hypothetical protein
VVILRVFRIDKTSSFVFTGLMRYWRHFGNHFTVVDESLVRQARESHWKWTWFLVIASLIASSALINPIQSRVVTWGLAWYWYCFYLIVLAVVGGKVWLRIGKRLIDSQFTSTGDQLMERLRSLEACPRDLDLSFRYIHAMCHRNTWFFAVKEFARRSDVVLMDLRGYMAQRSGCKTEVNFLFDAVPLARLLFLID